jgi:hypothetical protein
MTRLAAHGAAFVQRIRECGCEIRFRIGSMERMRLCEFRDCSKVLGFMEVQRIGVCELWFWGSDCRLGLVGWFCERELGIEVDGFGAGVWVWSVCVVGQREFSGVIDTYRHDVFGSTFAEMELLKD